MKTTEQIRLDEAREQKIPWKKWGPYLSERMRRLRDSHWQLADADSVFHRGHPLLQTV